MDTDSDLSYLTINIIFAFMSALLADGFMEILQIMIGTLRAHGYKMTSKPDEQEQSLLPFSFDFDIEEWVWPCSHHELISNGTESEVPLELCTSPGNDSESPSSMSPTSPAPQICDSSKTMPEVLEFYEENRLHLSQGEQYSDHSAFTPVPGGDEEYFFAYLSYFPQNEN